MDPLDATASLERILCSASLHSILETGMMDPPRQRHLDGDLAELIIYPANISDHDRQRGSLSSKKVGTSLDPAKSGALLLMHRRIHMFPRLVEIQSPPVYLWLMMEERMQMLPYSTVLRFRCRIRRTMDSFCIGYGL